MTGVAIETIDLCKRYGSLEAVSALNLRVHTGDIYGFLGRNGAGKTTTLRMMLGLVRPTRGTVRVGGLDIRAHRREILARVGALVDAPCFYGHLTARENLRAFGTLLDGVSANDIDAALDAVGLLRDADRKARGLSQGMRQRLGIARTLLNRPPLMVLDEPTNGLDPVGMAEIRHLLRSLARARKVTILFSSHLLNEVQQVCNRIGILDSGRLVVEGDMDELLRGYRKVLKVKASRPEEALQLLRAAPWAKQCDLVGDEIHVLQDREAIAKTCRLLVEQGLEVTQLFWSESTLEDYFLWKTGGDVRAQSGSS